MGLVPVLLNTVDVYLHILKELVRGILESNVAVRDVDVLCTAHGVLVVAVDRRIIVGAVCELVVELSIDTELFSALFEGAFVNLAVSVHR